MRPRRKLLTVIAAAAVAGVGLVAPAASSSASTGAVAPAAARSAAPAAAAAPSDQGKFTSKAPTRIMDTRRGLGWNNALGAAGTATLQVGGVSGIPSSGVSSVVFNITVTGPTSAGFLTVYPYGKAKPTASTINFRRGWTGANLVTVALGSGKVRIYNSGGNTDVIVDVVGWYADASAGSTGVGFFQEAQATRLLDTRSNSTGPITPLGTLTLPFSLEQNGVNVNSHVKSVAVTLTAVSPPSSGYLTAWSGTGSAPTASVLNFQARTTVSNLTIVPVAPCPSACGGSAGLPSFTIKNGSNGSTQVLVDIWGYYDDGNASLEQGFRYKALSSPIRIVDTRSHLGTSAPGNATTRTLNAPSSVAGAETQLLVQNITSIPTANTFLTFWRAGQPRPTVSNISPRAGRTVAGLAYTGVGPTNNFSFYNATGTNQVLVDVAGSFERDAPAKSATKATVAPASAVG